MTNNYFELFAVPLSYAQDLTLLRQQYYRLQQHYHPDKQLATALSAAQVQEYSALINHAYLTLKDPVLRAEHWLMVQGFELDKQQLPLDFLEEQMELQETLQSLAPEKLASFAEKINALLAQYLQELHQALALPYHIATAQLTIKKIQFYQKMSEQLRLCVHQLS